VRLGFCDVIFGLTKARQPFLKFKNSQFKSYYFSNSGLDIKPVSLIYRILWQSAEPFSGLPQNIGKE
jgi:hypothetical protein